MSLLDSSCYSFSNLIKYFDKRLFEDSSDEDPLEESIVNCEVFIFNSIFNIQTLKYGLDARVNV